MEQFLDNLSLSVLEELKKSAQENGDLIKNADGEAEVDKLLMMHMSKQFHDEEKDIIAQEATKPSPTLSFQAADMDPPSRRDSLKKKRPAKTRVMQLAMETLGSEDQKSGADEDEANYQHQFEKSGLNESPSTYQYTY